METEEVVLVEDRTTRIARDMPKHSGTKLVTLLQKNKELFAYSLSDMPGIDPKVIKDSLRVNPNARPIKQKKRNNALFKRTFIKEQISKLLTAGVIREVSYPEWLSNPVVATREDTDKLRMCIDFTNVNDACSKDSYPTPSIDRLVDSMAGHARLSFLDAYSGYHQIRMDPADEEKMSFISTSDTHCYIRKLFGLKNAGATYQRLMDKVFSDQIGRILEVYVDDIIVKIKRRMI